MYLFYTILFLEATFGKCFLLIFFDIMNPSALTPAITGRAEGRILDNF